MGRLKALFLDRDGVINIDHGYVGSIEDFQFVEGVLPMIRLAQEAGYLPIIVTNQSGIGRGYYSREDFEKVTRFMIEKMREAGIEMNREQVFFCPHTPDEGCACRKPRPGMLLEAKERFGLDMEASWMIGDKAGDIEAARAAGVGRRVLVQPNQALNWKELNGF
ncbi:D-glycero-beta-D-manno-heptose 1,7-bisphosphate 7-phosphatase [Nitratifractor salsuginis]|uniref:D,D-heptose 1,7-bisphosphate phosphatase n=1 Tax=Nitratifractor salsuginis (strain DSM 16511 / JCM 12458 / E9I37-1) TaxID=749222 RepID=E6WZN6_NITSE|nr:D-glycero-beta-D-manno-heptose 1,7-bisphosphate 7-phosphatase [Nitratifractor salsuginis]ADV46677.1 D-alpha,beta-D-heptose 1,7-bisphosphate phosphatase [Nitratifractor salsuginis DSM 16511]